MGQGRGVQIWCLNVAVLMMWSGKCEIPTDVHDSHSTVAMAQLFPGKMSMDFSLSGFLTLLISEVLLTTIPSFFSSLNSDHQPPQIIWSSTFRQLEVPQTHFAFICFFWKTHSQSTARPKQAKCTYNKSPAQKLKHWIIVPDHRSNKELGRCQHFLS